MATLAQPLLRWFSQSTPLIRRAHSTGIKMRLSPTNLLVDPAPIPQVKRWGTEYDSQHGPLIDLCQGAPADPPAPLLRERLVAAGNEGLSSKYGPIGGLPQMREGLVEEMKTVYGKDLDVSPADVALTAGCNLAFYAAMTVLADRGDEVILPVPWYFNHQMSLKMQGVNIVPLLLDAHDGFRPTVEKCEALITSKTRAITLVTPNNPTGAIYPPELITSFAILAQKHNVALILDETYRDFVPTGAPHDAFTPGTIPNFAWREHIVHLFSFSKAYAVPGYRLGAIVAAPQVIERVTIALDCLQICPPMGVQNALHPILPQLRPGIRETAKALAQRQTLFREICPTTWRIGSQGGYFAYVRHPFPGQSSADVSKRLAREMGMMLLPGSAFTIGESVERIGGEYERWVRFAVANVDEAQLREVGVRLRLFEETSGWALERTS